MVWEPYVEENDNRQQKRREGGEEKSASFLPSSSVCSVNPYIPLLDHNRPALQLNPQNELEKEQRGVVQHTEDREGENERQ